MMQIQDHTHSGRKEQLSIDLWKKVTVHHQYNGILSTSVHSYEEGSFPCVAFFLKDFLLDYSLCFECPDGQRNQHCNAYEYKKVYRYINYKKK